MAFRPLDEISPHTNWSKEDGTLDDYGHRWLNKLRSLFLKHDVFESSLTPSSVNANSVTEEAFSVTGIISGAHVSVSPPSITAGVGPICARASDDGEISITFVNPTAGGLSPASGTYVIHQVRL